VIISLLNQKGGVGKTTLATHVAGALAQHGASTQLSTSSSTLLIDADPQGSALDWSQRRQQQGYARLFSVIGLPRETLHQEAAQFAQDHQHVIIDGPPRVAALARSAILASDLVLIPVQPSPYDIWASAEMVALIQEAKIYKPTLQAAFVINRKVAGTVLGRDVRNALKEQPLPALQTDVGQRIVFADSVAAGALAQELEPMGKAAHEIACLMQEILSGSWEVTS